MQRRGSRQVPENDREGCKCDGGIQQTQPDRKYADPGRPRVDELLDVFSDALIGVISRVADEENWRQIKDTLIQNVGTATIPVIKVEDSDYLNNRTLLLKHYHDGRDLQLEYAEKTLKYVQQLWGRDVAMETTVDNRATLLSFSDGKFAIKKAA